MEIPALPQSSMASMENPEACLVFADCSCKPGETYSGTRVAGIFVETLDELLAAFKRLRAASQGRYGALHLRGRHVLSIKKPGYGSVARCFR
jgi:hypothetical protein